MAGITDPVFRYLCRKLNPKVPLITYSEMVSAAGLFYDNREKSLELTKRLPNDSPFYVQLFGNDPKHFAFATKLIKDANGIDINFGCPVKKVIKQGSGCALMRDPLKAKEIVKAVTENTDLPVSIKIRAGIENINALKFLEPLADLNWQTAIVHGRTFKQGFSGPINFKLIKKIKEIYPNKTIIANGGIFNPETAKEALEKTSANGVAIGRGVFGNPWIFTQIQDYLNTNNYKKITKSTIKKTALDHTQLMIDHYGETSGLIQMRKHFGWYFRNFPKSKELRKKLMTVKNPKALLQILQ